MKKTYIVPFAEVIEMETTHICQSSIGIYDDKEVDTETDQLGRENYKPYRPNLWEQGW